ncbi:MAG: hypothetical protein JWM47_4253 [Acidimicrobiales bacterium]|nr:hypothetical protein [Acidimicrobiales bacterium]
MRTWDRGVYAYNEYMLLSGMLVTGVNCNGFILITGDVLYVQTTPVISIPDIGIYSL